MWPHEFLSELTKKLLVCDLSCHEYCKPVICEDLPGHGERMPSWSTKIGVVMVLVVGGTMPSKKPGVTDVNLRV